MKNLVVVLFILFSVNNFAQTSCDKILKPDSCVLENPGTKELVDLAEVKIKNNYHVQFIKHPTKNYLKIIVKDNLGFGKSGSLLLYCNKKQIYVKKITLQPIDKNSAYFIIELIPNYAATLKENGLSSIIFCETTEFAIPKTDSEAIKKTAGCFYDLIIPQKK